MCHLQPLPVGLPLMGEGGFEVAQRSVQGPDDQVVEGELADRLEPLGNDGLLDAAFGRLEVFGKDVAAADVFRCGVVPCRRLALGSCEHVKQERLQKKDESLETLLEAVPKSCGKADDTCL